MKRFLPFAIIIIVLVVASVAGLVLLRSSREQQNSAAPTPDPAGEARGAQPPHIRGNPNAPVTLEEFGDFQCPTCGLFYTELKKIEEEYGDRLRVIFRELPLVPMHQHGLEAAQAAEAAGLQGESHFWEMHDKLYENQKAWSDVKDVMPTFIDYARQIGLDIDSFSGVLSGDAVDRRIFEVDMRAHCIGVTR